MNRNGHPKVSDFGYAKVKAESRMHTKAGSLQWMAPEVFEGSYTLAADVYSLAVVFWEVLTAEIPWSSSSEANMILSVLRGERPLLLNDVDAQLSTLIEAMWSGDPNQRPSMKDVVGVLTRILPSFGDVQGKPPAGTATGFTAESFQSSAPPMDSLLRSGIPTMKSLLLQTDGAVSPALQSSNAGEAAETQQRQMTKKQGQTLAKRNTQSLDDVIRRYGGSLDTNPAAAMFRLLPGSGMTLLDLSEYCIGVEGATALAQILWQTQVEKLSLWKNGIGDDGVHTLADALAVSEITAVDIGKNNVLAAGTSALAKVLPNSRLTTLDLGGNCIGTIGARAIAAVLALTHIKILNLCDNCIGVEGMQELSRVLPCTQITALDVCGNAVGAAGAKALAGVLAQTRITSLDVGWNNIGTAGMQALAAVLGESQVTRLNLGGNEIDPAGAKVLAAVILRSRVTTLCVTHNAIGMEAETALKDVARQRRIAVML